MNGRETQKNIVRIVKNVFVTNKGTHHSPELKSIMGACAGFILFF